MQKIILVVRKMKLFSMIGLFSLFFSVQESELALAGISYEQGQRAIQYAQDKYKNAPNTYLATKGIRNLLLKMPSDLSDTSKVLDFGCGPGTMTSFYQELGFRPTGVDISSAMISEAKRQMPSGDFRIIQKGTLPFDSGEFDGVFTSFVLLEIEDRHEIVETLRELKRVAKNGMPLIVVTTSEDVYKYQQYSFVATRTDFPENDVLMSGQKVKLQLRSLDYPFEDYFWSDSDYRSFFQQAGFQKVVLEHPMGTLEDETYLKIKWLSEMEVSPISVYWVQ